MAGFWQQAAAASRNIGSALAIEGREAMRGAAAVIEGNAAAFQRQDVQAEVRLDVGDMRRMQEQAGPQQAQQQERQRQMELGH